MSEPQNIISFRALGDAARAASAIAAGRLNGSITILFAPAACDLGTLGREHGAGSGELQDEPGESHQEKLVSAPRNRVAGANVHCRWWLRVTCVALSLRRHYYSRSNRSPEVECKGTAGDGA